MTWNPGLCEGLLWSKVPSQNYRVLPSGVGELEVLSFSLTMIIPVKYTEYGGIWGAFFNIPKSIFYLLKGDYEPKP